MIRWDPDETAASGKEVSHDVRNAEEYYMAQGS